MKILFLYHDIEMAFGTYLASTAPALAARGHEVHILTCWKGRRRRDEIRGRVWVHHRPHLRVPGLSRLMQALPFRRLSARLGALEWPSTYLPMRLNAALSSYYEYRRLGIDFDVIEVPEHMAEGLLFALFRAKPLVVALHGPHGVLIPHWGGRLGWHGRGSDFLERMVTKRATLTVVPSQLGAREFARAGWTQARDARVIPLTIDADFWMDVPPVGETRPLILQVGHVGLLKGSDVLIRAAAMLATKIKDLEVVFAGSSVRLPDGRQGRDVYANLANELGVSCRFVGPVRRAELKEWYGAARVVAVPSRFDTFPQVALEAMASGRPVVVSSQTGFAELDHRDEAGIAVTPVADAEALAAGLEPYLTDAMFAAATGNRGRTFVTRGPLSPHEIAGRRETLYRDAVRLWAQTRIHAAGTELGA